MNVMLDRSRITFKTEIVVFNEPGLPCILRLLSCALLPCVTDPSILFFSSLFFCLIIINFIILIHIEYFAPFFSYYLPLLFFT